MYVKSHTILDQICLDIWSKKHAELFHEDIDEDYTEIRISDTSSNERLYQCDICSALYKEEKNYRNHLALLHKKALPNTENAHNIMLNNDNDNLCDDEHVNATLTWDSKGGAGDAE